MATGIVDLLKTGRAKLQTHKCYDFLEVARPDFDLVAVEKNFGQVSPSHSKG